MRSLFSLINPRNGRADNLGLCLGTVHNVRSAYQRGEAASTPIYQSLKRRQHLSSSFILNSQIVKRSRVDIYYRIVTFATTFQHVPLSSLSMAASRNFLAILSSFLLLTSTIATQLVERNSNEGFGMLITNDIQECPVNTTIDCLITDVCCPTGSYCLAVPSREYAAPQVRRPSYTLCRLSHLQLFLPHSTLVSFPLIQAKD
jgi:hypothetical protein